jgi:hypothetical protein
LLLLLGLGTAFAVGAGGTVRWWVGRLAGKPQNEPTLVALMKGSLVFSLALFFPVVGWFLLAPLTLVFAVGAGAAALCPGRGAVRLRTPDTPTAEAFG